MPIAVSASYFYVVTLDFGDCAPDSVSLRYWSETCWGDTEAQSEAISAERQDDGTYTAELIPSSAFLPWTRRGTRTTIRAGRATSSPGKRGHCKRRTMGRKVRKTEKRAALPLFFALFERLHRLVQRILMIHSIIRGGRLLWRNRNVPIFFRFLFLRPEKED